MLEGICFLKTSKTKSEEPNTKTQNGGRKMVGPTGVEPMTSTL
jgi:hypothetical protein